MRTSPRLLLPEVICAPCEYRVGGMLSHSNKVTSTASILMSGLALSATPPPVIPEAEAAGRGYPGPHEARATVADRLTRSWTGAMLAFGWHRSVRDDGCC